MDYAMKMFRSQAAHALRQLADQVEGGSVGFVCARIVPSVQQPSMMLTVVTSDGETHNMDVGATHASTHGDRDDKYAGGYGESIPTEVDGVRVPLNGTRHEQ